MRISPEITPAEANRIACPAAEPRQRSHHLSFEDHVLVFTGEWLNTPLAGDVDHVQCDREERMLAIIS